MSKRRPTHPSAPSPTRLSKGQELALFIVMLLVLLALVIYGLQA